MQMENGSETNYGDDGQDLNYTPNRDYDYTPNRDYNYSPQGI